MSETTPDTVKTEVDHVELLKDQGLSTERFMEIRSELFGSPKARRRVMRFAVPLLEGDLGKLASPDRQHVGVCLCAIGENKRAVPVLSEAAQSPAAKLALVKSRIAIRDFENGMKEAVKFRQELPQDIHLLRAEMEGHESRNDVEAFKKTLESARDQLAGTADLLYYEGFLLEKERKGDEASAKYNAALELNEEHPRALFRLAYRLDMAGYADDAIDLYERCRAIRPTFASVYLNLGVLYDDQEEYQAAIDCYNALLDIDPNNERAKLFLKDAVASLDMYYDEDQERREDKLNQILKIPVTDFELSVRSRNCLERMRIRTLGDLIKKTEPELLSYKNFGETSLAEIKEILNSKSLKLGMGREELERTTGKPDAKIERLKAMITGIGTPSDDILAKPISELELSVRSRRCMTRLGIQTVGELVAKSEEELLSTRNFGQTSLVEIREKLRTLGLNLKEK